MAAMAGSRLAPGTRRASIFLASDLASILLECVVDKLSAGIVANSQAMAAQRMIVASDSKIARAVPRNVSWTGDEGATRNPRARHARTTRGAQANTAFSNRIVPSRRNPELAAILRRYALLRYIGAV